MRVCVITTGGTIGCVGEPLAPMPAAEFAAAADRLLAPALAAALPDMELHVDSTLSFDSTTGTLDSTDLRPGDWCRIARHLLGLYGDYDGFVVLHGTDTMDYTGAALPFLLNVFDAMGLGRAVLSRPVILTGAQLPLFRATPAGLVLHAGSDALANLQGALACTRLGLPEVGLFFDGRLWRGSRALKVSTRRFAGFDSPHLPPLAEVGIGVWTGPTRPLPGPAAPALALDDPAAMARVMAQLDAVQRALPDHPVIHLPMLPAEPVGGSDLTAAMIGTALDRGARGIVLEGHGEGNIPQGTGEMERVLRRAEAEGAVVLIHSRAIGGSVGVFHYAAGAWIAATGATGGGDMTPVAGVAKLTILLAAAAHHGWDRKTLRALLQRSLAGECSAGDRLAPGETLLPGRRLLSADGGAELHNDPVSGLVLHASDGAVAWRIAGRGRLALRDAPEFLGRDGGLCWRGPSGPADGVLILSGGASPCLALYDPSGAQPPIQIRPD